jgi:hypothetical protein
MGVDTIEGANNITSQKDYEYILGFFHFFIWNSFGMKSIVTYN